MTLTPIREFALKALLWLPLGVVLWFWFAAPFAWPPIRLGGAILTGCWPDLFAGFRQGADILDASGRVTAHAGYLMHLTTNVVVVAQQGASGGGVGVLQPVINPMVYGYALPLFSGLAMATPLTGLRRTAQIALAFVLIWLAQAFGIAAEALKILAFNSGSAGSAAIARAQIPPEAVALAYQFGYLILPAVLPIALWIGLNRDFIVRLVARGREPAGA
jgi:hypothetical protein